MWYDRKKLYCTTTTKFGAKTAQWRNSSKLLSCRRVSAAARRTAEETVFTTVCQLWGHFCIPNRKTDTAGRFTMHRHTQDPNHTTVCQLLTMVNA